MLDPMLPWFREHFGNPHSTGYQQGRDAAAAIEILARHFDAERQERDAEIDLTSLITTLENIGGPFGGLFAAVAAKRLGNAGQYQMPREHWDYLVNEHPTIADWLAKRGLSETRRVNVKLVSA